MLSQTNHLNDIDDTSIKCKAKYSEAKGLLMVQSDVRTVVTRGGAQGERELDERWTKVQTSSYDINKYQSYNEQHGQYS